MSQNDFTIANQGFPAFRADLNSALQALASNSSGATAPSTTFANMWWYDSTNNIMYIRNEDNDAWIKFAELDQTNDKFVLSGTLQLDDGTVSAPALTFNSDTNMGIYRGGTDILKFVTAGTDAVTIDANQNVGISTVPSTWSAFTGSLQIDGASFSGLGANNTALGSNAYYNGAWKYYGTGSASLYQQNAGEHRWDIAGSGTADNNTNFSTAMKIANNGDISFYEDTGTTPKLFWDASAECLNVGTTTSEGNFNVNISTPSDYPFRLQNTSSTGYGLLVTAGDGSNALAKFRDYAGNDRVYISGAGDVGIGTVPSDILHIKGGSSTNVLIDAPTDNASLTLQCGSSDAGAEGAFVNFIQNTTSKWQMGMNTDNSFRWYSYPYSSEVFKIDTGGQVVSKNSQAGTTHQLWNTTTNPYGLFVYFSTTDTDNNANYFLNCQGNGTDRCTIFSDGDVKNHDNSYGALSDIKLKEQITDASSQWEDIKALTVRKYKMKDDVASKGDSDDLWRLGVVAQEVETAGMGGLVADDPDMIENEDGEYVEAGTTTKRVKYSILYMKAVKALQEAMERIETLEQKVATLEGN